MDYLVIGILLIFILYPIISAKGQLNHDNEHEPYTSVTTLMGIAIFISVILSIVIALNTNMSASVGHGGLIYIIGPAFYGMLILILYLVLVVFRPIWKFISGLACVLINISIGFAFLVN